MLNIKDNNILNVEIAFPNYTELKERLSRKVSLDEAKGERSQNNSSNTIQQCGFFTWLCREFRIVILRVIGLSFLELSVIKLTLIKFNAFKLMVVVTKKLMSYIIFQLT
jgi:hypothetical protein